MTASAQNNRFDSFSLARKMRTAVWVYDIDHQHIVFANDAACKLWDAEDEDVLRARNMSEDMSVTVKNRLKHYQTDFIAADAEFNETWTLYPKGEPVTINAIYTGFIMNDGRMAMMCEVLNQDAQTTETLRSTQALLHTEVSIALFKMDGTPLYKNPAAWALMPDTKTGLEQFYINPDDFNRCQNNWQNNGECHDVAKVNISKGEKWLDINVRKCLDPATGEQALLMTAFDVSELKAVQDKSMLYQEQLEATFSTSLDGIIIIDDKGEILEFNDSSRRIFGYEKSDVLGNNLVDLVFPKSYRQLLNRKIERLCLGKSATMSDKRIEIEAIRSNGETFISELAISQSKSSNGNIFIIYVRDISHAKAAERALKDAKNAAEQANIAKSEFLANMSHEIRTPMNGVLGMIEVLQSTELTAMQKECTDIIHQSGNNLLVIISDILDYSKLEAGKVSLELAPCNLQETIKDVSDLLRATASEKQLTLDFDYDTHLPKHVRADANRIKQIISNLLGNAIKFTPRGTITVSVSGKVKRGKMFVNIAVKDTGIGIDTQKQALIFDKFTQAESSTTREYGGTGLGLAISKNLAHAMDGDLSVISKVGFGSIFTLSMPLEIVESAVLKRSPATLKNYQRKQYNFLVVDSDAVSCSVFSTLLNHPQINISCASSASEAKASYDVEKYDMIFIDTSINAAKTLREIEARRGGIAAPIIGLCKNIRSLDDYTYREEGLDDCVPKPLEKDTLFKIIAKFMKHAEHSAHTENTYIEPQRRRA